MHTQSLFRCNALAAAIAAALAYPVVNVAAQEAPITEEVIVTGVRSAQQTAISIERDAAVIVDAISAEDIGKLPDVTITDSLQRIGGVQIRRSAGEGASLNVRGMAQVLTELNGESYLGANSITSVQPNYTDIPSQLFSGAEVYKSQTASQQPGGISGVVNLKTYRPFDFDQGLTVSGAVEATHGADTGETEPSLNGLLNWNNDGLGVLVALSHQRATLANYYAGLNGGGEDAGWTGFPGEDGDWDWTVRDPAEPPALIGDYNFRQMALRMDEPCFAPADDADPASVEAARNGVDLNGNGTLCDSYWSYQGHAAFNRVTERERNGLNLALQADLGSGFELVAEAFLTDMQDYDRQMGVMHSDKWQRWGWFVPSQFSPKEALGNNRNLHTVQEYVGNGRRFQSYSAVRAQEADSQNYNVELTYNDGGALTASARLVHGKAQMERLNSYMDIDLANGSQWDVQCQYYPAGTQGTQGVCADGQLQTNPGGYAGFPVLTVNYAGGDPAWSGFDNNANLDIHGQPIAGANARSLNSYLGDVNNYALGALASENNFLREGTLDVLRLDGNWALSDSDFLQSVDFGVRYSARSVDNDEFDLLSPIAGCNVKWKATDVVLSGGGIERACTAGDGDNAYTAGTPTPIAGFNPIQVSDFGSASGIPAVWTVDPSSMDDVEGYHQRLYPGTFRASNPGRSFEVDLSELSYFTQANFASGIISGNLGVRAVTTSLDVLRNEVGSPQPYGAANADAGDVQSSRSMSDLLPALNLRADLTEGLVARLSVTKTLAPLDLQQWGSGLAPNYALDSTVGSETEGQFIVIGANADGNPDLDPWRAANFDASVEYYLGSASALSLSWFYIDVESFIEQGTVSMALPDQDGVTRRSVSVSTSVQGEGGNLQGLELSSRLAFSDITSGLLADFGSDVNYTYSPSSSGNRGANGESLPFQDNSEHVFNVIGWYEAGPLQARIAYNYRSERVVAFNQTWGVGTLWQRPTHYVDASVSYDVLDNATVYLNASNITAEKEQYYIEWEDQFAWQSEYEPRFTLGIRATL